MIRITDQDFQKLVKLLLKEAQQGASLTFKVDGVSLTVTTVDKSNKEMIIELSDLNYPFMPRLTKTETF